MKKMILTAAVAAAAFAAPAVADTTFAIQHFNQDIDSEINRVDVPPADRSVIVSTTNNSAAATAFEVLNESVDRALEVRGKDGATSIESDHNAEAAAIFEQLRAESDGTL